MGQARSSHPDSDLLERFMRNDTAPEERRWVVRHLIAGCAECVAITGKLWKLGESPASRLWPRRATAADEVDEAEEAGAPGAEVASERPAEWSWQSPAVQEAATAAAEMVDESAVAGYGRIFERLSELGRRCDREHGDAPRRVAALLARSPGERLALVRQEAGEETGPFAVTPAAIPAGQGEPAGGGSVGGDGLGGAALAGTGEMSHETEPQRRLLTPAVCGLLLAHSREAATAGAGKALALAELALAVAERLDIAVCGAAVTQGLTVSAWAHIGQARRLAGDLDGAEWALAMAESLAGGEDPLEAAELQLFRVGLEADRGRLAEAEDLLERAAETFSQSTAPRRLGGTLALLGLVRAERGDAAGAMAHLRSAVRLLDLPAAGQQPADWRPAVATLCRLAGLLAASFPPPAAASASSAGAGPAAGEEAADRRDAEAMQALERARVLVRGAGDAAAEARICHLRGEVESALGRPEDAERSLRAAIAALAQQGLGKEALHAQVELFQLLAATGRAAALESLARQRPPRLAARDRSWSWYAARLVFENHADGNSQNLPLLAAVGRYLAPARRKTPFPSCIGTADAGLGQVA
jgi:tetratricopeptide (TPR) repeat protein